MNRKIWKALGIAVCMLALAAPRAMAELREYLVSNNEHFPMRLEGLTTNPTLVMKTRSF